MTIAEIINAFQQRYKFSDPRTIYVTYPPRRLPDGVPDHGDKYCAKYPLRVDVPGVPTLSDVAHKLEQQLPAWKHITLHEQVLGTYHKATWGPWILVARVQGGRVLLALDNTEVEGPDLPSALSKLRDRMKERRANYEHLCELLRSP